MCCCLTVKKVILSEFFEDDFKKTKMTTNKQFNVYYEIPIIHLGDINTKEEGAYLECYDSTTRPSYVIKTTEQILENIADSCSKNHKGLYIMIEDNPLHYKEMKQFYKQIAEFLVQNYPQYICDFNSFLASQSNIWFTRIVVQQQF